MKKKKKEETALLIPEEKVNFKINLKNLRKDAYPDPLTETDYLQIKPGTHMKKGNSIYEVISIYRSPMTDSTYNRWITRLSKFESNSDVQNLKNLIESYKKNGNFGVCYFTIKAIIRGNKALKKGRDINVCEIEQSYYINPYGYKIVDLNDLATKFDNLANDYALKKTRMKAKVSALRNKELSAAKRRDVIQDYLLSKLPQANIQVEDEELSVEKVIQLIS